MATKKPQADYLNYDIDQNDSDPVADYIAELKKQAPAPAPSRTIGEAAKDTLYGLAGGVGGLVSSVGDLGGVVTGRMDNPVSQLGKSAQEYWTEKESPYLKAKQAERDLAIKNADGVLGKASAAFTGTLSEPSLIADTVAGNAATFIPGGLAGKAAMAAKAARGAEAAASMTPEALAAFQTSLGNTGARAAISAGAVQQASDVSGDGYRDAMAKTDAQWEQNPEYLALAQQIGAPAAKHQLALSAARAAFLPAAAISYGANSLPGGQTIERAILGGAAKQPAGSFAKGVAKGALGETVTEALEEGGGKFASNLATQQYVDPNQDLRQDVGQNAGMGAAGGFAMGAATGGFHGTHGDGHGTHIPEPLPDTGPLSRAANAATAVAAANAATVAAQTGPIDYTPTPLPSQPASGLSLVPQTERDPNSIDYTPPAPVHNTAGMDNLQTYGGMGASYDLAPLQETVANHNAQPDRQHFTIIPHANGGYTAAPTKAFTPFILDSVKGLQSAPDQQQNDVPAAPPITHEQLQDMATRRAMAAPTGIGALTQAEQSLAQQRQADEQARQDQAQRDAEQIAEQTKHVDARVAESDRNRAEMNRADLREQILKNPAIVNKKEAFAAEMRRQGFNNPQLTAQDHAYIDDALAPVPSAPNELVDAVPEKVDAEKGQAKTNTAAVDAAIATGMRLKNPSGSVLHKKGSTKIFKLSDKQKAYYLQAIKKLTAPVQSGQEVPELAPVHPIEEAAHEAATSPLNRKPDPTEAQTRAGNYKKGHIKLHGLDISIENPVGSTRSGIDKDGVPWETVMNHHYGYIRGTTGMDKDHIDTFIGSNHDSDKVFVVDQIDPSTGKPDEHKVMLGFDTKEDAHAAYKSNYAEDWTGDKDVTETTVQGFKDWLNDGDTKKPFANNWSEGQQRTEQAVNSPHPLTAEAANPAADSPDTRPVEESIAPKLTKQQLNKMTVKDMTDANLLQAREVFADSPRAPKIEKEIKLRGLDKSTGEKAKVEAQYTINTNSDGVSDGFGIAGDNKEQNEARKPIFAQTGDFGPILTQFYHDAQGAIKALTELQDGEAVAALHHPEVGDIDLVWGVVGTKESNGSGLAKLVKWHPEVLDDLQGVISSLKVVEKTENRIQLESATHKAAVRLEWDGKAKHWLLTAFEKRNVGSGTRTDTTAIAVEGDTARLKSDAASVPPAAPEVKAPREAIATRYAQLLAEGRDGVSPEPKDFHYRLADDILAKNAYALKWITNGLNATSKKVFSEFVGIKLPKAQGASWEALKEWAGITKEQDDAFNAKAAAELERKRQEIADNGAEREATNQIFKKSATDDTFITGKEVIDRQISEGFTSIENISKTPIPKYVLVNVELGRFYPLDKIGRRYAELALKRLGKSEVIKDTDGDNLVSIDQVKAEEAEHEREMAQIKASGQTVASDAQIAHLFGKDKVETKAEPTVEAAPIEEKEPIDTGDDIPVSFFKKIKVDHEVWIEDENKSETVKISAHKALASVREDLSNYQSLLNCLRG